MVTHIIVNGCDFITDAIREVRSLPGSLVPVHEEAESGGGPPVARGTLLPGGDPGPGPAPPHAPGHRRAPRHHGAIQQLQADTTGHGPRCAVDVAAVHRRPLHKPIAITYCSREDTLLY